jgi:hypothetical protein
VNLFTAQSTDAAACTVIGTLPRELDDECMLSHFNCIVNDDRATSVILILKFPPVGGNGVKDFIGLFPIAYHSVSVPSCSNVHSTGQLLEAPLLPDYVYPTGTVSIPESLV